MIQLRDETVPAVEAALNTRIKELAVAIKKIEAKYENFGGTTVRNQASVIADIDAVRDEFRTVKGQVEEVSFKAERGQAESKKNIDDFEFRLREIEKELKDVGKQIALINGRIDTLEKFSMRMKPEPKFIHVVPENGATPAGAQPVPGMTVTAPPTTELSGDATTGTAPVAAVVEVQPGATTLPTGETATDGDKPETNALPIGDTPEPVVPLITPEMQGKFDKANEMFSIEEYKEARKLFATYINKYPDNELTDNSQFKIAETYYKQKDFEKAVVEYEKVITKYKKSEKIPSTYLRVGFSLLQLNYKDAAVNILKRLVKEYPETNQAEIARRKLKIIK